MPISHEPYYDATKSYEENYQNGPFGLFQTNPETLQQVQRSDFLGFPVDIPFGIASGSLLNGNYVEAAWNWGYSIATYKTVRGNEYKSHPNPNILPIDQKHATIHPYDTVTALDVRPIIDVEHESITNSFGVPSQPVEIWQEDVVKTIQKTPPGSVFILSFMGTQKPGMSRDQYIADYKETARLAKQTDPHILEVNLSCPNVGTEGLLCYDPVTTRDILAEVTSVIGNTPLLIKIGYFSNKQNPVLDKILDSAYEIADGVVAINTIQTTVLDASGNQALPGNPLRRQSGICGVGIQWAGREMAERIVERKNRMHWNDFAIVGVGGVITAEDYRAYMNLGVDAVQSVTGSIWRPELALEIRSVSAR